MSAVYYTRRASRIQLEQHTKIFASMCPDEILDYYDDFETREYYTTLMLGDISGWREIFGEIELFIYYFYFGILIF